MRIDPIASVCYDYGKPVICIDYLYGKTSVSPLLSVGCGFVGIGCASAFGPVRLGSRDSGSVHVVRPRSGSSIQHRR